MDDILEEIIEFIFEVIFEWLFGGIIRFIKKYKLIHILCTMTFCGFIAWGCFSLAPMAKEIPEIGGMVQIAAYIWGVVSIVAGIVSVFKILVKR